MINLSIAITLWLLTWATIRWSNTRNGDIVAILMVYGIGCIASVFSLLALFFAIL